MNAAFEKVKGDLAYRTPGQNKPLKYIVLTREQAAELICSELELLSEIGLALESHGYVHMTNGHDIGLILDQQDELREALRPFAEVAPKPGEYLRTVRLVYEPSLEMGTLAPEVFLNAKAVLGG